jgi:pilus assembly protein FimV
VAEEPQLPSAADAGLASPSNTAAPVVAAPVQLAGPSADKSVVKADPAANAAALNYTVKRGDSLAQIAKSVAPRPDAFNASMAAIFESNRAAFIDNSIHKLREGAELAIPDASELGRRNSKAALQVLAQFDDRADPYFQRMAAAPKAVKPAQQADASVTGEIDKVKPAAPPPKAEDQLKVSQSRKDDKSGEAARNAQAEELLIREKALREANDRIAALEKNIADMQRLLELRSGAAKVESGKADAPVADAGKPDPGKASPADAATDPAKEGAKDTSKELASDKPAQTAEATAKPDGELAAVEDKKPEAQLEDEPDGDESKKAKPWYKNGLLWGGVGGALALGGGAAGFFFLKRRKAAAADDAAGHPAGEPTADLLNADLGSSDHHSDDDFSALAAEPADADTGAVLSDHAEPSGELSEAGELAGLGEVAADEIAADDGGALLSGGLLDDSADQAESPVANVDLDFETAAAGDSDGGSLLPPEMSAGDPPKPGTAATSAANDFMDELDSMSAQTLEAEQALDALKAQSNASADGPLDDDFAALGDDPLAGADALGESVSDETVDRIDDALAEIDLDMPGVQDAPPVDKEDLAQWQEMETKLDLAAAYIEIGDGDSAKELLKEVLKKGDAGQLSKARDLMGRAG